MRGTLGFPDDSEVKNLPDSAGDSGSVPGLGRCPGGGNGNRLQDSCLENPLHRGAWQATVHSIAKSQTQPSTIDFTDSSVSRSVMPDSLQPHGLQPTGFICLWDFPGKDTGVGCHFLLQGIFPIQGLNPDLLHCKQILYQLSH